MKKSHLGIYRGYDLMQVEEASDEKKEEDRQSRGFWTAALPAIL